MNLSDDELAEDEEEFLVYVEFESLVGSDIFSDENLQLDIIGIDSEHPVMQINGRFYEGTYEHAIGTYMFFEKDTTSTVDDPIFDTPPTVKYSHKTRKLLRMQRVFMKERTEVLGDSEHQDCIPNIDTIVDAGVPAQYQQQALSFWEKMRTDRIDALTEYLQRQKIRDEKKSQGIAPDSDSEDDNPFALYKYMDNDHLNNSHCNQSNENMDAGTQNIDNEESLYTVTNHPSHEEHQFVDVDRSQFDGSMKLHTKANTITEKIAFGQINQNIEQSDQSDDENESILPDIDSSASTSMLSESMDDKNLIKTLKSSSSDPDVIDKNYQKILKREKKMKEISNRLKVNADQHANIKME